MCARFRPFYPWQRRYSEKMLTVRLSSSSSLLRRSCSTGSRSSERSRDDNVSGCRTPAGRRSAADAEASRRLCCLRRRSATARPRGPCLPRSAGDAVDAAYAAAAGGRSAARARGRAGERRGRGAPRSGVSRRSSCQAARRSPESRWNCSAVARPISAPSRASSSPRTAWRWRPDTGWSWRTSRSAASAHITLEASAHESAKTHAGNFLWLATLTFWPQNKWISRIHLRTFLRQVCRS